MRIHKGQDFYFSASEARGEYFALPPGHGLICEYRASRGRRLIWATEVVDAGAAPVSRSKDLLRVAQNVRATYIGRIWAKNGDLWAGLQERLREA